MTITLEQIRAAATLYSARGDEKNWRVLTSMGNALERYGTLSTKQWGYASALIQKATAPVVGKTIVPKLFSVMQRHAKLDMGHLVITRKNGMSLCWLLVGDTCVGKIDNEELTVFEKRIAFPARITQLVLEIEADPLAAAVKYGKLSGRCCSCSRDLTDPESIAAGIGPICAKKFK